jgi:hypothetical protein
LPGALKNSKPLPVHANVVFDLDKPDMRVFDKFHEKLQDAIKASPEWAAVTGHKASPVSHGGSDFPDEDIPF